MMKRLLIAALLMPVLGFSQLINENFDGAFPPTGWTVVSTNPGFTWYQNTANPLNGTGSAAVDYDPALVAQNEGLISPPFDLSGTTVAGLTFTVSMSYYWSVDPNNNYDVIAKVSTDGGFSWTDVWSENALGVFNSYQPYVINVDLTPYAGNANVIVAFQYTGTDGAQALIDDVIVSTCIAPTEVTATGATSDSAVISFTGSGSSYEVEYGPVGFTPGTGTVTTITGSPYTLSGLADGTAYDVYVRNVCSPTSTSSWIGPIYFATTCNGAATIPYNENFEGTTSPYIPPCTTIENAGTGNNWLVAPAPGYGFTSNALLYPYNSTNAANAWFFTKGLNLTGGQAYTLTYKYGNSGADTFPENLRVSYGTTATAAGMTTMLADHPGIAVLDDVPLNGLVNFTPPADGVYYIGFNAYSAMDEFWLMVDDINVSASLANAQFDASEFSFYPNPVKDVLNISSSADISSVEVFNLLGQQMIVDNNAASQKQVNMSGLAAGNYLVKVYSADKVRVIKVIKE